MFYENNIVEINEAEIFANFETYAPRLCEMEEIEGALIITAPQQEPLALYETLWYLVENLSFKAIIQLLNHPQEFFHLTYYSSDQDLVIIPTPDYIKILSDAVPTARYKKADLFPQLYRCGCRYLELLKKLEKQGKTEIDLDHWRTLSEEARQALSRQSMLDE